MIVWVKKEATGRPNNQRAEILRIDGDGDGHRHVAHVVMCGDGVAKTIPLTAICGIEIPTGHGFETLTLSCEVSGSRSNK